MSTIAAFYTLCRETGVSYADAQDYLRIARASRGNALTGTVAVDYVLGDNFLAQHVRAVRTV